MLSHLNKSSEVGSNQSSAGDSDRGDHRWDERLGFRASERKHKKPGACEQGRQTPGDSLLCAQPTLRRSFQICRGREVAALLRPWLRRSFHPREGETTFSGGFFPWRASNRLAAGAYSFHRVAGRSNGQLELCVLELVDQLGHNKYFDAAR